MSLDRDRRTWFSLTQVLTLIGMLSGLAGVYAANGADNARQKERVDNLKEQTDKIEKKVDATNESVQLILRKLVEMETARKMADTDARDRDRAAARDRDARR